MSGGTESRGAERAMTIQRLYERNGEQAGFWVQHRSWGNACALVRSVGGRRVGHVDDVDHARVVLEMYDVRSGRRLQAGERPRRPGDKSYAVIARPAWWVGHPGERTPKLLA